MKCSARPLPIGIGILNPRETPLCKRSDARSRSVATSGIIPMYQKSNDTVAYVETANTSQSKGERKLGQIPFEFGIGARNHAIHARPTWIPGKIPAQITAKMVIASAARFTAVLQFCLSRHKIAEISVPA